MNTITKENTNIQFDITSITVEPIKMLTNVGIPTIGYAELKSFLLSCKACGEDLRYQFVNVIMNNKDARDLLECFKGLNRIESADWYRTIAKAMSDGQFDENIGDAIVFDKNGVLRDGNHRVIGASMMADGKYVTLTVCLGGDTSIHTDITKRRNPFDSLVLTGKITQEAANILDRKFQQMVNILFDVHKRGDHIDKVNVTLNAMNNSMEIIKAYVDAVKPTYVDCDGKEKFTRIQNSPAFRMALLEAFLNQEIDSDNIRQIFQAAGNYDVMNGKCEKWMTRDVFVDSEHKYAEICAHFNAVITLNSLFDSIYEAKNGGGVGVNKDTYCLTRLAIRLMDKNLPVEYNKSDKKSDTYKRFCVNQKAIASERSHFAHAEEYTLSTDNEGISMVVRKEKVNA